MFLTEHFGIPGDVGFPLGGVLSPPANREEGERFRAYLKQVRLLECVHIAVYSVCERLDISCNAAKF